MMTPIRTATALVALLAATPALAQTPSNDDLAALVRQQAAEIATLRARLDRWRGRRPPPLSPAPCPPPPTRRQRRRRLASARCKV